MSVRAKRYISPAVNVQISSQLVGSTEHAGASS